MVAVNEAMGLSSYRKMFEGKLAPENEGLRVCSPPDTAVQVLHLAQQICSLVQAVATMIPSARADIDPLPRRIASSGKPDIEVPPTAYPAHSWPHTATEPHPQLATYLLHRPAPVLADLIATFLLRLSQIPASSRPASDLAQQRKHCPPSGLEVDSSFSQSSFARGSL